MNPDKCFCKNVSLFLIIIQICSRWTAIFIHVILKTTWNNHQHIDFFFCVYMYVFFFSFKGITTTNILCWMQWASWTKSVGSKVWVASSNKSPNRHARAIKMISLAVLTSLFRYAQHHRPFISSTFSLFFSLKRNK